METECRRDSSEGGVARLASEVVGERKDEVE